MTGASSGIGEACTRAFAALGAGILMCARRLERLEKLAEELRKDFGVKAHALALDVRDRDRLGRAQLVGDAVEGVVAPGAQGLLHPHLRVKDAPFLVKIRYLRVLPKCYAP